MIDATVEPGLLAAEALDDLDGIAEMMVEVWPIVGDDEDVRRATVALAEVVEALRRGDRGAALLAAEVIRRRQIKRHVPRTSLAWRGTPWPEDDGTAGTG